ncbi:alpha/beta fold hydrolase [Piscinibacter sakaiensis]|uniref:alpha/beta fold hydrolase n=1 Tax=Piscinibacter sakaiensis TaxID=1547922 RepID=UPI003AAA557E
MPLFVDAGDLNVAYLESGDRDGPPVILLHGFPYDVQAYQDVAPRLANAGYRVIVPWLRGFGPTRFADPQTLRSGQQAALAHDLLALLDALQIEQAIVAGYDWGGRAACIVAALWPQRVKGLVSVNGYNIQDIARSGEPTAPEQEWRLWYQYYFHGERGRAALNHDRRALCRLLWQQWSPTWGFDETTFALSAQSFDNPDFVEVVIHSYRHRFALVAGDPRHEESERQLAAQPKIGVPAITLDGIDDGVMTIGGTACHAGQFAGPHEHRMIAGAGHNLPQEAPSAFAEAVLDLQWMG